MLDFHFLLVLKKIRLMVPRNMSCNITASFHSWNTCYYKKYAKEMLYKRRMFAECIFFRIHIVIYIFERAQSLTCNNGKTIRQHYHDYYACNQLDMLHECYTFVDWRNILLYLLYFIHVSSIVSKPNMSSSTLLQPKVLYF